MADRQVGEKIELMEGIGGETAAPAEMTEQARGHTQQLAAAIEELSASSSEIGPPGPGDRQPVRTRDQASG